MKTKMIAATVLSMGLIFAGSAAFAEEMKKDTMAKEEMSKDGMKKDEMKKDEMKK